MFFQLCLVFLLCYWWACINNDKCINKCSRTAALSFKDFTLMWDLCIISLLNFRSIEPHLSTWSYGCLKYLKIIFLRSLIQVVIFLPLVSLCRILVILSYRHSLSGHLDCLYMLFVFHSMRSLDQRLMVLSNCFPLVLLAQCNDYKVLICFLGFIKRFI